ncbi:MAG TPA: hypothetical protein VF043_06520 [Ktedonobacteraceae bacterium]
MAERLKEQINPQHLPMYTRRASAIQATQTTAHQPASRHYAGHAAGIHPEDAPSMTRDYPRRTVQPQHDDEEEDDALYPQRPPSSARRYRPPHEEVYTQGNRQIVVHREPPPGKRRFQWMVFMGMVMFVMVLGWLLLTAAGYWWQGKQEDFKYGTPRTFQVDQYIGHGDTPDHPDHFIALNVGGMIQVIELNPLFPKYDHVYPITRVNDRTTPVLLSFEDTRHTGKLDMLVTIGESNAYTVILLNNGTQFTK